MPDAPDRLPQPDDFRSLARRKAIIHQLLTVVNIKDLGSEHRHCGICREDYSEMDVSQLCQETDLPGPEQEHPVSLPCSHVFGKNTTCLGPNTGFTYQAYLDYYREVVAWQKERAGHVAKLQAKAVAITEALDFLDKHTLQNIPMDSSTRYVAEQVAERPELLTDESCQTARYYRSRPERHWRWHARAFMDELADLIKADVENGKNLDGRT
ncbi:DNA mismatch repair protein msh3 [Physcia stellaris]|nr:DNA mismatch repair protein msh3 [Physcia stellaris]